MEIAVRSFGCFNIIDESVDVFKLFQLINNDPLIDRFYRRYVRREDNFATLDLLMARATGLNNSLLDQLVEKLRDGIKGAELSYKSFGEYLPIRLAICDLPYCLIEEDIPLEDYDNLEGDPLWMRPEYMLEKYG